MAKYINGMLCLLHTTQSSEPSDKSPGSEVSRCCRGWSWIPSLWLAGGFRSGRSWLAGTSWSHWVSQFSPPEFPPLDSSCHSLLSCYHSGEEKLFTYKISLICWVLLKSVHSNLIFWSMQFFKSISSSIAHKILWNSTKLMAYSLDKLYYTYIEYCVSCINILYIQLKHTWMMTSTPYMCLW